MGSVSSVLSRSAVRFLDGEQNEARIFLYAHEGIVRAEVHYFHAVAGKSRRGKECQRGSREEVSEVCMVNFHKSDLSGPWGSFLSALQI